MNFKKESYDALVFDLDGTIVFNGYEIEANILEKLRQLDEKVKIIFASARPVRDMLPLLEDFPDNDLIGGNGSIVRMKQGIFPTQTITPNSVEKIVTFIQLRGLEYVIDYDWNYSAKVSAQTNILNKLDTAHKAQNVDLSYEDVIKIIIFGVTPKFYQEFNTDEELAVLYHSDVQELVITAKNINKYQVLSEVMGQTNYIGFGNDKNDVKLLQHAKLAISVGDNPEVFQVSHEYLPAESEKIAAFLEKLILDSRG
ncbi:HAD-IIB family hydrolase [Lactococcus garvieae]|uniref:HAD-IIB family hydrolase n=1 Tax=Lactococcus garvieae TaxID=1363 RepID=UPI00030CAB88|nr:HAD family hydrolase [Lactococcus garvieae]EOT33400.1 hypothetical protein OO3_00592 [Lactococcus garvieae ATCC 49156]EOT93439.1 hypothetical protein I578_00977 [Lactococcus garvieae ATCC 49156]QSQ99454.1 HAD family phosphatase [Lactococcus garvieae]BDW47433.1 Cof-type HAD-IIB family hydrolase [Lactococcus garvieae]